MVVRNPSPGCEDNRMSAAENAGARGRRHSQRQAAPPTAAGPAETEESPQAGEAPERSEAAETSKTLTRPPGGAGQGQQRGRGKANSNHAGRAHGRDSEHGWRDLAGNTPSQVGVQGALRARDVARPRPEDVAAAERDVVVVRRQWQPPAG